MATTGTASAATVAVQREEVPVLERRDVEDAACVIFSGEDDSSEDETALSDPINESIMGCIMKTATDRNVQKAIFNSIFASEREEIVDEETERLRRINSTLRDDLESQQDLNNDLILFQNRLQTRIDELEAQVKHLRMGEGEAEQGEEETKSTEEPSDAPEAPEDSGFFLDKKSTVMIAIATTLVVLTAVALKISPAMKANLAAIAKGFLKKWGLWR